MNLLNFIYLLKVKEKKNRETNVLRRNYAFWYAHTANIIIVTGNEKGVIMLHVFRHCAHIIEEIQR